MDNTKTTKIKLTFDWRQEFTCVVDVPTEKLEEVKVFSDWHKLMDWLHEEFKDHTDGNTTTISYELESYEEVVTD